MLQEDDQIIFFKVLKHPIRREILLHIGEISPTYTELWEKLNIERGHLNYHLKNLKGFYEVKDRKYIITVNGERALRIINTVTIEYPKRELLVQPRIIFILSLILVVTIIAYSFWPNANANCGGLCCNSICCGKTTQCDLVTKHCSEICDITDCECPSICSMWMGFGKCYENQTECR